MTKRKKSALPKPNWETLTFGFGIHRPAPSRATWRPRSMSSCQADLSRRRAPRPRAARSTGDSLTCTYVANRSGSRQSTLTAAAKYCSTCLDTNLNGKTSMSCPSPSSCPRKRAPLPGAVRQLGGQPIEPDPKKVVTWGEQTHEEMLVGYVEVASADQDLTLGGPLVRSSTTDAIKSRFVIGRRRYQGGVPGRHIQ